MIRTRRQDAGRLPAPGALFALLALTMAHPASAQTTSTHSDTARALSQIIVTGTGEVSASPDRGVAMLGVESQAPTAAEAASENARLQSAVISAIRALGIPPSGIRTLGYSVTPIQRYDEPTRRFHIDGYQVSNIVEVQTDSLHHIGRIIDAALAKGANRVAGIDFLLTNRDQARDKALAAAVASARRQADIVAAAADGRLGPLLNLTVQPQEFPGPQPVLAARAAMAMESAPTPVGEGVIRVTVQVTAHWQFIPKR